MLIDLARATAATCGGKTAPLARLLAAGLDVPPGFVVPVRAYQDAVAGIDALALRGTDAERLVLERAVIDPALVQEISSALSRPTRGVPSGYVAVRSSATTEDGPDTAAAGAHESVLGVRGAEQVVEAVRRCWASLWSTRAIEQRRHRPAHAHADPPGMAVLVQPLVEAEAAGVMFTGATTRIEASWGLGQSVVAGQLVPDSWEVTGDAIVSRVLGAKTTRTDRAGTQVVTREVSADDRDRPCLRDAQVLRLARLGRRVEHLLGEGQDVEWAIADGHPWILQSRPVTAALPSAPLASPRAPAAGTVLRGTAASPGRAAGPARVLRGPDDFVRVRRGDVLVCATTDPTWTPLFAVAAAVVTETGGLLSHAAIVARERGLPAVVALPHATTALSDGAPVHVDGSTGHVVLTAAQLDTATPEVAPPPR